MPFSTNALKKSIGGRDEAPTPRKITLTTLSSFFDSKLVGTQIGCIVSRGLGKRESQQGGAGRGGVWRGKVCKGRCVITSRRVGNTLKPYAR